MTDQSAHGTLLFARNGANRPLHQDRQVLRAGDLSLEQATQDAMLARARRYLHGWGVVGGFMPEVADSTVLTIGPGYGVTPFGDELFLPEPVSLPDAADAAVLCCGPGPFGCEVIDPAALAEARRVAGGVTVTAWLIARPASREAALRPGVPDGCAHPASTLLPSRRCGGVEFAILCTLPPSHQPKDLDCGELMPFVCGIRSTATPPLPWNPEGFIEKAQGIRSTATSPLPWETPLGPEANFLVIARLTVTGGALTAGVGFRRTLWPVALIQDWIASCVCPEIKRSPAPDKLVGGAGEIRGGGPAPPLPPPPAGATDLAVNPAGPVIVEEVAGFVPENPPVIVAPPSPAAVDPGEPEALDAARELRDRLDSSVTEINGVGAARARVLAGIGVTTEGEFLTAPTEQLAKALNVPEDKVVKMKERASRRHNLGLAFR